MLTAITRAVSPSIVNCELTFVPRRPIHYEKACQQHRAYETLLEQLGACVHALPAEPDLPDSMFVEDPVIVLDELAVILPLGTEARRREADSLSNALSKFRKLEHIVLPGTMEGGDVLRIGRKLYCGLSGRTNAEGIRQLAALLAPYAYEVVAVPVTGCLHLKSQSHMSGATRCWPIAPGSIRQISPGTSGSRSTHPSRTPQTASVSAKQ